MKSTNQLEVIGQNELVNIGKRALGVPAKIDTGAYTSAIWASNIKVGRDGVLKFSLFGPGSKYYTGKVYKRTDFEVAKTTSSSGHVEIRYRVKFPVTIAGHTIRARFSLADRSRHRHPILIGRRTIKHRFLVDVTKKSYNYHTGKNQLNAELQADPYAFYQKHSNQETKK